MACGKCQGGWIFAQHSRLLGPAWARADGDGWEILVPRGIFSTAERCPCSTPAVRPAVRPTPDKVMAVVTAASRMIPFFPSDPISLKLIVAETHRFCDDVEKLERFAHEACRYFTKWQGLGPWRALYCALYSPADGIYPTVTFQDPEGRTQMGLPGYTESELLAKSMAAGKAERAAEEERYARLVRGTRDIPALPEAKRIP